MYIYLQTFCISNALIFYVNSLAVFKIRSRQIGQYKNKHIFCSKEFLIKHTFFFCYCSKKSYLQSISFFFKFFPYFGIHTLVLGILFMRMTKKYISINSLLCQISVLQRFLFTIPVNFAKERVSFSDKLLFYRTTI